MPKTRIGLIGVTHRAVIAKHWQDDGRGEIVAGCDIRDDCLQQFQTEYGDHTFMTKDYEELVQRNDIDAVGIFTPDNLHEGPAIAALKAGKHVFLEKPMAITTEGCDNIIRAQRESGRKLMIGFHLRYNDFYNTMKDIVGSGMIGEVKSMWVRNFVSYGGWAFYHDYRANRRGSMSLLLQNACHDFDIIHYMAGQYATKVVGMGGLDRFGGDRPNDLTCGVCHKKEVCPEYTDRENKTMCCFRREVDVEDENSLLIELSGGTRVTYMQCLYAPDNWRNYSFNGTKGRIESLSDNNTIRVYTQKGNAHNRGSGLTFSQVDYRVAPPDQGFRGDADPQICYAFLDYVIDGIEPRGNPVDARMATAVGVQGAESLRHGNIPLLIPAGNR